LGGNIASARLERRHPSAFRKWLWNNDGWARDGSLGAPKVRAASRVIDPFSAVSLRPAEDITARRQFFSMNSKINHDGEENPASGFRPQLNPNRL
jgi:hypothetical protein